MLAATPLPRPTSALRLPFSPRARAQIGLFLLAYLVYSAARFVTIGDLPDAQDHARWIVNLENATGTGVEASVQNAFDGTWVMWILNHLYLIAQLGVIPAVLIFLYKRNTQIYAHAAQHDPGDLADLGPGLRPVPRRSPAAGRHRHHRHDHRRAAPSRWTRASRPRSTTSSRRSRACTSASPSRSASPSFAALRNPALKFLALLWGPVIGLAVVATGNHFVFDMVAGVVASAAGYGLGAAAARIRIKRPSTAGLGPAFAEA